MNLPIVAYQLSERADGEDVAASQRFETITEAGHVVAAQPTPGRYTLWALVETPRGIRRRELSGAEMAEYVAARSAAPLDNGDHPQAA